MRYITCFFITTILLFSCSFPVHGGPEDGQEVTSGPPVGSIIEMLTRSTENGTRNSTVGWISGTVLGESGMLENGIPYAVVTAHLGGVLVVSVEADSSGNFILEDVPDGSGYTLTAAPPDSFRPEEGKRGGYLHNSTFNVSVMGGGVERDIKLPYEHHETTKWLHPLLWSPLGRGVPLDEPVHIQFSRSANRTSAEAAVRISPGPADTAYAWNADGTILRIDHGLFLSNTSYEVLMRNTVLSFDGYPLWNYTEVGWSFTTGQNVSTWRVHTAEVELVGMNLSIEVTGKGGISVYVVITGVGSFLLEEGGTGNYSLLIKEDEFEFDTTYNYHISDRSGGPDLVPVLSGTFRTEKDHAPALEWHLESAEVALEEDGAWTVEARGGTGQMVFIIIEGVGSYSLVEKENGDGNYTLKVGGDAFVEGGDFSYYFSDSIDGDDLAPPLSGTLSIRPQRGTDRGSKATGWIIVIVLTVVIAAMIAVFIMTIRSKGEEGHPARKE